MDTLTPFLDIARDPFSHARSWKNKTGAKIIGHFCSYTPEEIIVAAGALPFRLFGSTGGVSLADAHLQVYSCSVVRGALDDALAGRLDFLDGTVFPHTCDAIQRLSDIWRLNAPCGFHLDMILPVKLNTSSAREYMLDVIHKFRRDLESRLDQTITDEDLRKAVTLCNKIRLRLQALYEIRRRYPELIRGSAVQAVLKAAMLMDRNRVSGALDNLIQDLENRKPPAALCTKRLMATGGLCSMPDIYDILEDTGAQVVWDDFCTGSRYFSGQIDMKADVMAGLARRYLERIVCPAKHAGLYRRGEHILEIVRQSRVQGVIFLYLKFCDPHAFDYPFIKEMLDREGIPTMLLEVEDRLPSPEQLKTRCEAFVEML